MRRADGGGSGGGYGKMCDSSVFSCVATAVWGYLKERCRQDWWQCRKAKRVEESVRGWGRGLWEGWGRGLRRAGGGGGGGGYGKMCDGSVFSCMATTV